MADHREGEWAGDRMGRGPEPAAGAAREAGAARPLTGEPRVDEALTALDGLAGLPVAGHAPVFERVGRQLRDILGELEAGSDRDR